MKFIYTVYVWLGKDSIADVKQYEESYWETKEEAIARAREIYFLNDDDVVKDVRVFKRVIGPFKYRDYDSSDTPTFGWREGDEEIKIDEEGGE